MGSKEPRPAETHGELASAAKAFAPSFDLATVQMHEAARESQANAEPALRAAQERGATG